MTYKTFTGESIQEAVNAAKMEFGNRFNLVSQEKKVHRTGLFGLFGKKEFFQVMVSFDDSQPAPARAAGVDRERQEILERIAMIRAANRDRRPEVAPSAEPVATVAPVVEEDRGVIREIADLKEMLGPFLRGNAGTGEGTNANGGFARIRKFLERNDFGPGFIESTLEHLGSTLTLKESNDAELVRQRLERWLHDSLATTLPNIGEDSAGTRLIALVGPTGVGKTTTLAKIGAELALVRKKKVAFVTMDNYRIGAQEQIEKYAEIMNLPVHMVHQKEQLETIIADKGYEYILLDTAGRNQKKELQIGEIRRILGAVKVPIDVHLVVSATTKYGDLVEIMKNFETLRYERMIVTKVDETNTFGSLISALAEKEKSLVWLCMGQDVPTDIKLAERADLVGRVMMHYRTEEALVGAPT